MSAGTHNDVSLAKCLTNRRFLPFFLTQFAGAFNDNFFKNALVILITFRAESVLGIPTAQMVVASGGVFILPFFLFSGVAGEWCDKFAKTRVIRWVKISEIVFMTLGAWGFFAGNYGLLLFVLFLMGLHSTVFGPVKYSSLPELLSDEELLKGNALVEAGTFLAILLGTIAGGSLILLPAGPLYVSSGLLLVAVGGYLASLKVPPLNAANPNLVLSRDPFRPTVIVLKAIAAPKSVRLSVASISWFWLLGAAVLSLLPPYTKEVLQSDEKIVTLFLSLFSIGIAVGSALSRPKWMLVGGFGMSVFLADLFWLGNPSGVSVRLALDLFLFTLSAGLFVVPLYTRMQRDSDPAIRSRVVAGNNILNSVFMVVSAIILYGLMGYGVPIPTIWGILAVANLVYVCALRFTFEA